MQKWNLILILAGIWMIIACRDSTVVATRVSSNDSSTIDTIPSSDDSNGTKDTQTDTQTDIETDTQTDESCNLAGIPVSTVPSEYDAVLELPNPFIFVDQTEVSSISDWDCRRQELLQLIQAIEYGPYPPLPKSVLGTLNGNVLTVTIEANGKTITFDATVHLPAGNGPFPAFVVISSQTPCIPIEQIVGNGMAHIAFDPIDIAADGDGYTGNFYQLYDNSPHTGNLLAWAWAVHRVIDALSSIPSSSVNISQIAAAGCRRYAKASLLAGVFDQRVALTVTSGGGSAGINSWRAAEAANIQETNERETIHNIGNAPFWFTEKFVSTWEENVNHLPFDAHEVISLVAPRALIAQEGQFDAYNTNLEGGPFQSMWAARIVYNWIGAPDAIGWVTDAYSNEEMTTREIDAIISMANRIFKNDVAANVPFDSSAAPPSITWSAPILEGNGY